MDEFSKIEKHQLEIQENLRRWNEKPLLQEIYSTFYDRIIQALDLSLSGKILEIGSGVGNLKRKLPQAICSDIFPNPWLDLVCDAYRLPFSDGSISNIILFDVFHHLERPFAFLRESRRVLCAGGRLVIFEPYISVTGAIVYGLFHPENIGWKLEIDISEEPPKSLQYYAAQGNVTRIFFKREYPQLLEGWKILRAEPFSSFAYLLSGGYSRPALYPRCALGILKRCDDLLTKLPGIFGARCLVVLTLRHKKC